MPPLKLVSELAADIADVAHSEFSTPNLLTATCEKIGSLFTRDRVEQLTESLFSQSTKWDNLSEHYLELQNRVAETDSARIAAQSSLARQGDYHDLLQSPNIDEIRAKILETSGKVPEEFELFADHVTGLTTVVDHIDSMMDLREQEFASTFNLKVREFGLPSFELRYRRVPDGVDGLYGDGSLSVRRSSLLTPNTPGLYQTTAHELTHGEQQFLVSAHLADINSIAARPSPSQQSELMTQMEDLHMNLSESTIAEFFRVRDGRQLTDEAAERAHLLGQAHKELGVRFGERAELSARHEALERLVRTHNELPKDTFAKGLLGKFLSAEKDPEFLKSLFGPNAGPLAIPEFINNKYAYLVQNSFDHSELMSIFGSREAGAPRIDLAALEAFRSKRIDLPNLDQLFLSEADEQKLGRILRHDIARAKSQYFRDYASYHKAYMSSLHEREAFSNGDIAAQWIEQKRRS